MSRHRRQQLRRLRRGRWQYSAWLAAWRADEVRYNNGKPFVYTEPTIGRLEGITFFRSPESCT